MRTEKDVLGQLEINDDALYGVSSLRSVQNFTVSNESTSFEIIQELINIKKQAAITNLEINELEQTKAHAIIDACDLLLSSEYIHHFIVPKYQGGAGTSTNMNVNEVIANKALELLDKPKGSYDIIHPINDINKHQSTNDVYPTAIKIVCIKKIRECSNAYSLLQQTMQEKETEFDDILKLGRTQYTDAVPLRVGQMFSAFASVFSRDRWRIYKTEERLRTINIGGTAIGTGLNAPLSYTFKMTEKLRESTNLGLSRAENMIDNTQNLDVFAEVSGLLKTAASSLIKISNDLRFLSSGPNGGIGEIIIPSKQVGSSIMPGKINPVILELVIMTSHKIISNDTLITSLVSSGTNELNPFLPMIGETLIESLSLLTNTVHMFNDKVCKDIKVNRKRTEDNVIKSTALITPLIEVIGYDKASEIIKISESKNQSIKKTLLDLKVFTTEEIESYLNPYNITKPGKVIINE